MAHVAPDPRSLPAAPPPRGGTWPPVRRGGARDDGLTPAQRGALLVTIAALHVAAGGALLQVPEVREAVAQATPLFVSLIAPTRIEPTPPPPQVVPPPRPPRARPPERVVAAPPAPTPTPTPPGFVVPLTEPEPPVRQPEPAVAVAVAAPPAPIPEPPPPAPAQPQPKTIPSSAVQYLEPPSPTYPAQSKRLGETGRVTVRVFIDPTGAAKDVRVDRGSGHPRLDEAALVAVQRARFKPYTENGLPLAGWAFIPIDFELER
jgi:protein TonB